MPPVAIARGLSIHIHIHTRIPALSLGPSSRPFSAFPRALAPSTQSSPPPTAAQPPPPPPPPKSPRHPSPFSDPEYQSKALASKATADLLLSYGVFGLCLVKPLVDNADTLLDLSSKFKLTDILTKEIVRRTFFKQFCGGETDAEVEATITRLQSSGVGAILDLAYEADVESESEGGVAKLSSMDDPIFKMTQGTIDVAGKVKDGVVALKVTAFASPSSLVRISTLIRSIRSTFLRHADPTTGRIVGRAKTLACVEELLGEAGGGAGHWEGVRAKEEEVVGLFEKVLEREGWTDRDEVDWTDFATALSVTSPTARPLLLSLRPHIQPPHGSDPTHTDPSHSLPTPTDFAHLDAALTLVSSLVKRSMPLGVKVLIDAETYAMQPAIDAVAMELMCLFNPPSSSVVKPGEGVVVFNTVQMYLTDSGERLKLEVERSEREGYSYGVKLVRGAYMVAERERAKELNLPSPIHPSLSATHASFDSGVSYVLSHLAKGRKDVSLVVATHNADSIAKAMDGVDRAGVRPGEDAVRFAQLYGMMDIHTFTLAALGYRSYKYVPYGPLDVCVPYLLRRAQENKGMLGGAGREMGALRKEVGRRVVGGGWA